MYKNINGVNYEIVNANTAKGENLLIATASHKAVSIYQCYKNPSYAKVKAFEYWYHTYYDMKGYAFEICSFNTFMFTVSWAIDGAVFYITPSHNYMIVDLK